MKKQLIKSKVFDEQLCVTILKVLALAVRVQRTHMDALHNSEKYVVKALSKLRINNIIKDTEDGSIVMTRYGIKQLELVDEKYYEYFCKHSRGKKTGYSPAHNTANNRRGMAICTMAKIGVAIGPDLPPPDEIVKDQSKKLPPDAVAFVTLKEIKYSDRQNESRLAQSRATGILISPGINGAIFCLCGNERMTINKTLENEMAQRLKYTIYGYRPQKTKQAYELPKERIIIGESYMQLLKAIKTEKEEPNKKYTAIKDILAGDNAECKYRYFPLTEDGQNSLSIAMHYSEDEVTQLIYTKEEVERAKHAGRGDAIIGDVTAYQYITGNISKLQQIILDSPIQKNFGIDCLDIQKRFVMAMFQNCTVKPKLKVHSYEHIRKALEERRINAQ